MTPLPRFGLKDWLLLLLVLGAAAGLRVGYLLTCLDSLSAPPPLAVQDAPAFIALADHPPDAGYSELLGLIRNVKEHAWGGTLAITRSRMPLFARPRPGIWSASGYSGHGVALAVMAGRILAEAIRGEAGRFDLMAALPAPPFPGGTAARAPLLALAMSWYAMRDRLGI